jgi:D-beta-D-heptose 7-phosphate kinase/D-beta-D-heptose 1-phosphate adenosyltransferase
MYGCRRRPASCFVFLRADRGALNWRAWTCGRLALNAFGVLWMTSNPDLVSSIDRFPRVRVLCVGDVMLDCFVYGHVERVSPEAPIPVLRIEREASMLGGAGNVLRNIAALGARAEFISVVGDDLAGHDVIKLVGDLAGTEPHLLVQRERQTTIKRRFVAGRQQLLRADLETVTAITNATVGDIIQMCNLAIVDCDVLVLSDYAKGVLTARGVEAMIAIARAAGKPVIVDPKLKDFTRYRGATLLTPNRRELAEATGQRADGDVDVEQTARAVIRDCAVDAVLCTRGAEGMTLVVADGPSHQLPATASEVFDVSGAGDTVVATLSVGIAAGLPWLDAARLANVAAGLVVGKVGTAVVYSGDLTRALQREAVASSKIVSRAEAADYVARWRCQGLTIGLANGCFDLLHPGHVSLITQAKAASDRLIIGLNTDASVRRLKGKGRPVQSQAARALVLASLASVDLVVLFGDDMPVELIKALQPDVLVKGAEYEVDQVAGAQLMQSWGGRVLLARRAPGHSTAATIRRIAS